MTKTVVGVDLVEVARIGRVADRYGQRFLSRVYTAQEIEFCQGRTPQLATRFAAKEAVMKALGTGIRGVGWRDVEVVRERGRAPRIALHGRAMKLATELGPFRWSISLSHSKISAIAFVIGVVDEGH